MKKNKWVILIVVISIALRLIIVILHTKNPAFQIQQDNYANYATAIKSHTLQTTFPKEDRRLFPGYPVLIFLFSLVFQSQTLSGVLISLFSACGAIFLLYKGTKNLLATTIFAFFPPIWVLQATKVATEPILVFLLLLSVLLYLSKRFSITGILIGFAFTIRPIAICLLLAVCLLQLRNLKNKKSIINMIFGFLATGIAFLFVFNLFAFGRHHIFQQFEIYPSYAKATLSIIQFVEDIFRTMDWKQYRILFSGLFYVFLNLSGVIVLYKTRQKSEVVNIFFFWMLFSLIFIFTLGPTPFLEEFSRFSVALSSCLALSIASVLDLRLGKE